MGPSNKRLLVSHGLPGEGLATRGAFTSFLPSCGGAGVTPPDPSPKRKQECRRSPAIAKPHGFKGLDCSGGLAPISSCDGMRLFGGRVGQMPRAACFTNTCCRAAHPAQAWSGGREAEGSGPENRSAWGHVPWVRLPPAPPFHAVLR